MQVKTGFLVQEKVKRKEKTDNGSLLEFYSDLTLPDLDFVCYPLRGISGNDLLCDVELSKFYGKTRFVAGLCSSSTADINKIREEFETVIYLNLPYIVLPVQAVPSEEFLNLLKEYVFLKDVDFFVVLLLPSSIQSLNVSEPNLDVWSLWSSIRSRLFNGFMFKIAVGIHFQEKVNDEFLKPCLARRWLGEPLSTIMVDTNDSSIGPASSFVANYCSLECQTVIINGDLSRFPSTSSHLKENIHSHFTPKQNQLIEVDVPQLPLKPTDHQLSSAVYGCFEQSKHKYDAYKQAIVDVLKKNSQIWSGRYPRVLLVGAGRGGILQSILDAESETKMDLEIYAVEKNPNAFRTLEYKNKNLLNSKVTLIHCDLREEDRIWDAMKGSLADIIVSELLGSFACNELCPELLSHALKLGTSNTVLIPGRYCNYLTPVMTMKTQSSILAKRLRYDQRMADESARDQLGSVEDDQLHPLDRLYVTPLLSCYHPSSPQVCFEYDHGGEVSDVQEKSLEFQITVRSDISGFGGYFEALLDTHLVSTLPSTATPAGDSWFPSYFPLRNIINCEAFDVIRLNMKRVTDTEGVWYEWNVEQIRKDVIILKTSVQNQNGKSDFLKLYSKTVDDKMLRNMKDLVDRGILIKDQLDSQEI